MLAELEGIWVISVEFSSALNGLNFCFLRVQMFSGLQFSVLPQPLHSLLTYGAFEHLKMHF